MTRVRAGLIGIGKMGLNHLRVLSNLDEVELVGVADIVQVQDVGDIRVPVVANFSSLVDLGIDYCVVATPTITHVDIGLDLAAAEIPTLIEKPLAGDVVSGRKLVEAFGGRNLVAGVGHIERFNPALRLAREKIEQNLLGDIYEISTRRRSPFPGRVDDVGVVLDLATHDLDITAWIGSSPYENVAARVAYRAGRRHEDLVSVTGSLRNGIVTSHLVDWLSPYKERSIIITGEKGALVINTLTSDLTFYANGQRVTEREDLAQFRGVAEGDITRFALQKPEPLRTEHEHFRDAVLGRASDTVSLSEGMAVVRVCEGLLESARSGLTFTFD